MGVENSCTKPGICMKGEKIWNSVFGKTYGIMSTNVKIVVDVKNRRGYLAREDPNNEYILDCVSATTTMQVVDVSEYMKFRVEHVSLLKNGDKYEPYIEAEIIPPPKF